MGTFKMKKFLAGVASLAVLTALLAGCTEESDEADETKNETSATQTQTEAETQPQDPYETTGAFKNVGPGTADSFKIQQGPDVSEPDSEAKNEHWQQVADEAKEDAPGEVSAAGPLFFITPHEPGYLLGGTNQRKFVNPELHGEGRYTVYFNCEAIEPNVKVQVYVEADAPDNWREEQDGSREVVGGEFTCGYNELAEGSFTVDLSVTSNIAISTVYNPVEGYSVVGVSKVA